MIQTLNRILFFGLFFLAQSHVSAQSQYQKAEDSDPEAIKILESISRSYQSASAHRIKFDLDIELPAQGTDTQSGTLIQSGEKFVLEMQGRQIISDSDTVWVYIEDANEVQINDAEFDDESEIYSPADIFKLYDSGAYVFALSTRFTEEGKDVTQIEAKPVDPDSEYAKMRLTVIDQGLKVKRLKFFAKDGGRYTMHVKSHNDSYKVSDKTFIFDYDAYENLHIEDLRF